MQGYEKHPLYLLQKGNGVFFLHFLIRKFAKGRTLLFDRQNKGCDLHNIKTRKENETGSVQIKMQPRKLSNYGICISSCYDN